jgi:hypothetical protein
MKGQISCPHTHQLGCELVALLSAYREEERRLFPEVYLFGSSEADLLTVLAPGAKRLPIGQAELEEEPEVGARKVARTALKNCASLAIDGWSIYIQREGRGFKYGLFRPAVKAYSVGAAAALVKSKLPAAILRQSAENTVEIVNSVGTRLELSLTTVTPSNRAMSDQIVEFATVACLDVPTEHRELGAQYLTGLLTDFLRASHGALLAVAPADSVLSPEKFPDGVVFSEPIPLVQLMLTAMTERSAEADAQLRSHESLLRGMIMSDGITILGTDGGIRGFRVFVGPGADTKGDRKGAPSGGARTRAFESLKESLGSSLKAVLFRSQDGRTEVVVK